MLRLDSGALAIIPYSRMGEEKKEGYGRHPIIYIFIYISKALYVYIPPLRRCELGMSEKTEMT